MATLKTEGNLQIRNPNVFIRGDLRSKALANPDILKPTTSDAGGVLTDGEFVFINVDSAGVETAGRAIDDGDGVAYCSKRTYLVVSGGGRTDTQYRGMCSVLFQPVRDTEIDTLVYDGTSVVAGSPLTVGSVTIDGKVKAGLKLATGNAPIKAYCNAIGVTNQDGDGRLRAQLT